MAKTYKGKSLKPGGGGRFAMFVAHRMAEGDSRAVAVRKAAAHGNAKYGKKQMQQWAAAGRKRAAARRKD